MRPLDPIKQEKILQAVFTVTGTHGLAGISIAGISNAAGVGAGTLYTYFKSKEEIIQAAYSGVEDKMTQKMYEQFDIQIPVKQSLKKIYINMLNYRLNNYNETVFIDQYIQSNYIQLNFSKQMSEFEQQNKPMYDLLKKGQNEGIIKIQPPIILISFFDGAVRSCSNGIVQKLFPLTQQIIDDCFDFVWKGITQ
ncbi:TetR/AcrR family transcriptional regulator [Dyadobacter psychrotolerans]|uniref:TetR/AcrR family transcriptional regulator n=1 Tax=Dyadobacter psychrotolerans TaxID=2541721 RepID=A0A4R5DH64_9BACT|nr:TetR/AcrR family transcriptional regulator [Dyadobacter psychrotolerans]TDE11260.1 TetR/AcrR family transcriptional regulator [Dyadobacter psychrotolerans]